jgi:hypothetical protein
MSRRRHGLAMISRTRSLLDDVLERTAAGCSRMQPHARSRSRRSISDAIPRAGGRAAQPGPGARARGCARRRPGAAAQAARPPPAFHGVGTGEVLEWVALAAADEDGGCAGLAGVPAACARLSRASDAPPAASRP